MFTRWVTFIPLLAAAFLTGCRGQAVSPGPLQHETQAVELDKAEMARVELRMGAGELKVSGGSPRLMDADFTYDNSAMKPIVRYEPSSFRGQLSVEQPNVHSTGSNHYEWNLRLNNMLPMDFVTNLGAGNAEMNLGGMALRGVEIHMGIGNLDMDLRGDPKRDYNVEIHGGVGNATLHLPAKVGLIADAAGGIGHIEARGLEKHNGRWVNAAQTDAKVTIHLNIRGGVGNIEMIAE